MEPQAVAIPAQVRLQLAHGAAQHVADVAGVDVLHLKGLALDPELIWPGRVGSDVDLLVRPAHLATLVGAIIEAGWRLQTDFDNNSSFGHAATYWHDTWGYLDIHRYFPGLRGSPSEAFDQLFAAGHHRTLAGVDCRVPAQAAQRLVMVLHAGRGGGAREQADIEHAWSGASAEQKAEVRALVEQFGAQVGFAAAVGGLDAYRDDREYDLWRVASAGGTRFDEWRARVRAAGTRWEALKVILRAPLVNVQHLEAQRGRPVTRAEVAREFFARPLRGVREEIERRASRG